MKKEEALHSATILACLPAMASLIQKPEPQKKEYVAEASRHGQETSLKGKSLQQDHIRHHKEPLKVEGTTRSLDDSLHESTLVPSNLEALPTADATCRKKALAAHVTGHHTLLLQSRAKGV